MAETKVNPFKNFLSGSVGGTCLVLVGHPLDTIKVRLQTIPDGEQAVYKGTLHCIKQILKTEGFLAFYRGAGSMFVGTTPASALSFFGNSVGKKIQTPSKDNGDYSLPQLYFAGAIAAFPNACAATPIERIKCLLQTQETAKSNKNISSTKYTGSFDCALQLYKQGGIVNLYQGATITILRGMISLSAYFCTYDGLKRALATKGFRTEKLSAWKTMFAGGTAGVVSWLIAMPADVVKTRLQSAPAEKYPHGARDVFHELWKNEGIGSFYRGMTPILLRAFPANAACFLGYEVAMKALNHLF